MPDLDKFCSICGEEISRQKHMKDREGELYCMACHATKRKVLAQQKAQAAQSAAGVPLDAAAMALPLGVAFRDAEPEPMPETKPQRQAKVGSLVPSIIVLGLSVAIMTGLGMSDGSTELGIAIVAGVIRTIFVAVGAVVLIAGLVVTLRITGNSCDGLSDLAKVLPRALALVMVMSIFDYYTQRYESLWMVLFGFRNLVMIVSLIALFDLEFFDTVILSMINFVAGWVLTFILIGVLGTFVTVGSAGRPASQDAAFDRTPVHHAAQADKDEDF